MKKVFEHHLLYTEDQTSKLWQECIFVFDTNTLLNFYRYSSPTAVELENALKLYSDRIWIPHQVGLEYFRNRLGVIAAQNKNYIDADKKLTEVKGILSSKKGHPFISENLQSKFDDLVEQVNLEFETQKSQLSGLVTDDHFTKLILELFENRVGPAFSQEELTALYKDGKARYEAKIPPGFGDKKPDPDKYGDLIIWKQIMQKSKNDTVSIIFISDDERKDDWSLLHSGKHLGPLPELKREFLEVTGKSFTLYPAFKFLELAYKYNQKEASPQAIQEIKQVGRDIANPLVQSSGFSFEVDCILALNNPEADISIFENLFNDIKAFGYSIETESAYEGRMQKITVRLPFQDLVRRFREKLDILLIKYNSISNDGFFMRALA